MTSEIVIGSDGLLEANLDNMVVWSSITNATEGYGVLAVPQTLLRQI